MNYDLKNINNLGVPQGSGYPLYLFCEKTKKEILDTRMYTVHSPLNLKSHANQLPITKL